MKKYKVEFGSANNAALFVTKCGEYNFDVDLQYGRYLLDGASILGVMGISHDRECIVIAHTDDDELLKKFEKDISLWIVRE